MKAPAIPLAIVALAGSAMLLACSGAPQSEREPVSTPPQETAQPTPPAPAPPAEPPKSPTVGGDGSQVRLSSLSREEIAAAELKGELGCSFEGGNRETLLIAMGDVASPEPSFGVVKVGDHVETVSARGGFDAMVKGTTFTGRGKTIIVALTSSRPVGGGESPPYPARLTYQRADGASRGFAGTWACGP